jgi:hypothetical protein
VIGGMCYVILYPANCILDPDADTLELHPQWVKREDAAASAIGGVLGTVEASDGGRRE